MADAEDVADANTVRCNNCDHEDEGAFFIEDDPDEGSVIACPECGSSEATILA